jgi:hypothetical protein
MSAQWDEVVQLAADYGVGLCYSQLGEHEPIEVDLHPRGGRAVQGLTVAAAQQWLKSYPSRQQQDEFRQRWAEAFDSIAAGYAAAAEALRR